MKNLWCSFWFHLQDVAFWIDDRTRTCYAGDVVTRLAEKLTPVDY